MVHYSSTSCLFVVAMAGLLYSGQGLGLDLCKRADNPALCRSVVRGLKSPSLALGATIKQMMFETKRAMVVAQRSQSSKMGVCMENYDDAFTNLQTCLANLFTKDRNSFDINLSAALTDYVTCDDSLLEVGLTSPVTRINLLLRQMASNGFYLSDLIH